MVCVFLRLYFRLSFVNFLEAGNIHLLLLLPQSHCLSSSFFFQLALHFLLTLLGSPFLFFRFSPDFRESLLVVAVEALVVEVAFCVVFSNFVKIVHVELHDDGNYLPNKGGIVAVLEVFGQDLAGKQVLVDHDEADPVRSPPHSIAVLLLLGKSKLTLRSQQVFLRKDETALGLRLDCRSSGATLMDLGNGKIMMEIKQWKLKQECKYWLLFSRQQPSPVIKRGMSSPVWMRILITAALQQFRMQSICGQGQKLAMRQSGGESKAVMINGLVKEFVINTIDMVKNSIHEEEDIIDRMLELLQKNMSIICHRPSEISQKSTVNTSTVALQRIESAVEQLNRDSDLLSERIFDLSQSLIQKRLQQVQQEKREMQKLYENKIFRLKSQYQKERSILQSQLRHYQQQCSALEECLQLREGKQDHYRRQQLVRYLEVIEEIYGQLEILKNFSTQPSNQTDPYEYSAPPKAYTDSYSEQYYNIRKEERSTQAGSQQRRLKSPSNYNYVEYQNAPERRYYQLKEADSERRQVQRRSNSKSKPLSPRYVQIPLPQQSYYIKSEGERRERSRSTDRDKREGNSNYKVRPIILHYQTPEMKSPVKESEAYTRRSLKRNNEQESKRIEQKNVRMQGVQQKLQELKRKLERELKTMKS